MVAEARTALRSRLAGGKRTWPWLLAVLVTGAALGAAGCLLVTRARARAQAEATRYYADLSQKEPVGSLLWADTSPQGGVSQAIRLNGNFGFNPGSPHRVFSGQAWGPAGARMEWSYHPEPSLRFGEVILVRLELNPGQSRDFILRNGQSQVLYQDRLQVLRYAADQIR